MLYESIPIRRSYSRAFAAVSSHAARGANGTPISRSFPRVPRWMSWPISSVCNAALSTTTSSRPALCRRSFITNSAIGLLQMFPWHRNRIFMSERIIPYRIMV